jgi:hypothetical protein
MSQAVETMPALDLTFRSGYRLSKPIGGISRDPRALDFIEKILDN